MSVAPQWLFLILGPLFVAIGAVRLMLARRLVPQARAWLLIGAIFCAVAVWLRGAMPGL